MEGKLLPCPFCGGEAKLRDKCPCHYVTCTQCGAQSDDSAAIRKWNTRTPSTMDDGLRIAAEVVQETADNWKKHGANVQAAILEHGCNFIRAKIGKQPAVVGGDFDFFRVREWALSKPRKPANLAFTAGVDRNVAYLIEELIADTPEILNHALQSRLSRLENPTDEDFERMAEAIERAFMDDPLSYGQQAEAAHAALIAKPEAEGR